MFKTNQTRRGQSVDEYAEFMRYEKMGKNGELEIDEGAPKKKNGP